MNTENLISDVVTNIEKYKLFDKGSKIVAGISGGADSVCLLKVLSELKNVYDLELTAVHLNHCLRGEESDGDQEFVRELCEKWDIELRIFKEDIAKTALINRISLEEAGRNARYRIFNQVLEEKKADFIAVAHQKEDQAETVMLNILRGTGPDGLCGMKFKQGRIIRPLLNISRDDIEKYLSENGIPYRTDSTNLDSEYTRNRIRNELFPKIKEMFGVNPANQLVRLSELMQDEQAFLEAVALKAYSEVVLDDNNQIIISLNNFNNLDRAIKKRIIRIAWEKINNCRKNFESVHVEQVLALCRKGITGKKVELPRSTEAKISYDTLIIAHKQDESAVTFSYPVIIDGITKVDEIRGILISEVLPSGEAFKKYGFPEDIKENSKIQLFDYDKLKNDIVIRSRNNGDVVRPFGSRGEKKLKKYFIDEKIVREERDRIPLIAIENEIIWIIGKRTSNDYRARRDAQNVLVLSWKDLQDGGN